MATIREEAQVYDAPKTLNVAELEKFQIDLELKDGTGTDKKGVPFSYKFIEVDGKEYRVPGSVIGGIKAILKKMPYVQEVTVIRDGDGMNTRYQVIPYQHQQAPPRPEQV